MSHQANPPEQATAVAERSCAPAVQTAKTTPADAANKLPAWTPRTDVYQTDKATVVVMDLPGVRREDLDIETENHSLRISAKAPAPLAEGKTWLRREFQGRRYARTFRIGNRVDTEKMNAQLTDGVLTITMPYKAQTMAKKIAITD